MKLGLQLLVIENFQSLRGPVEIPIRPLTLLYGPNSAGKSAVFDALQLLAAFLSGRDTDVMSMLSRWAYKSDRDSQSLPVRLRAEANSFLSANVSDSLVALGRLPSCLQEDSNSPINAENPRTVSFGLDVTWREGSACVVIDIDGKHSLSLQLADDGASLTAQIFEFPFGMGLRALADLYDTDPDHEEAFRVHDCLLYGTGTRRLELLPLFRDEKWGDYENILLGICNWFLLRAREIFNAPPLVDAGRGVISDRELVRLAARSAQDPSAKVLSALPAGFASIEKQPVLTPEDNRDLISALGCSYLDQYSVQKNLGDLSRNDFASKIAAAFEESWRLHANYHSSEESLIQFVNRCLQDHLFIDQGYTVHFDVCEILPDRNSPAANTTWSDRSLNGMETPRAPVGVAALLLCSLRDKAMRSVTFEDVGTGISCVLPVIAALHSGYSFIQQPELHLHPALQSALGDVMVEAAHRDRGLHLIETHSEHLLLRCLKRLRQTAGGRQPENSPLRMVPDQLAVLYFDPQPDGTTRVKRIRVSEDGDFLDRWPRGFFEERARDLFDE